jgi:hypothetical protein
MYVGHVGTDVNPGGAFVDAQYVCYFCKVKIDFKFNSSLFSILENTQ